MQRLFGGIGDASVVGDPVEASLPQDVAGLKGHFWRFSDSTWARARPQPGQHFRQLLRTDIEMLADPPPQHRRGHIPVAALFLRLVQNVQNHPFLASQAVADIG